MDYLEQAKRVFQGYIAKPPKKPQTETAYTVLKEIEAAALIALAEEQRETNSLLAQALKIAKLYIEEGSLENLDDRTDVPEHSRASVLDSFTEHARESWPGPCGDEPEVG